MSTNLRVVTYHNVGPPWKPHIHSTFTANTTCKIQGASFIAFPSTATLSYTKRTSASTSRDNRHSQGNDKRNAALFTGKITTHCIQVTGPNAAFAWQFNSTPRKLIKSPISEKPAHTAYIRQSLTSDYAIFMT